MSRAKRKQASETSAPHRLRGLADVQDLIVTSVRAEYRRLWETVRAAPREDDDR
jgi:hypothetical protein